MEIIGMFLGLSIEPVFEWARFAIVLTIESMYADNQMKVIYFMRWRPEIWRLGCQCSEITAIQYNCRND